MAYPSDYRPRRRKQAVPTMRQMVRRRAASPGGVLRLNSAPVMGRPVNDGGIPTRRPPMDIPSHQISFPGGRPVAYPHVQPAPKPTYSGVNPNTLGQRQGDVQMPRNPMEHLDWWASKGWIYNPATKRFVFHPNAAPAPAPAQGSGMSGGRPVAGGGSAGGGGGGAGGGSGSGGGAGGGTDPTTGLPLDATYEAQRRYLDDILAQSLGAINPQRELLNAMLAQNSARLDTNERVDKAHLLESLAGRGAFGGGIQNRDLGYQATDYLRQRQDLANSAAQQNADLDLQMANAQNAYSQGLMEALLELANRQAQSQYAVTPYPTTTPTTGGTTKAPKWHPTWQPTWKPPKKR